MYIQLNSQVLYYEKRGEGRPLLMLHGNGEDHSIFDALAESLESRYTLYLPDTRGHGLSSPSKEYHYIDMATDMANLIRSQIPEDPAILGFSDGAVTAMLLAYKKLAPVRRLILCGGNLTPKGIIWSERHKIKKHYKKTKDPLYKLMLDEPNIPEKALKMITVPTLVIAGEKDMIKKEETDTIARGIPDSTKKIIPGADHSSYIINSDMLTKDIIEFLEK